MFRLEPFAGMAETSVVSRIGFDLLLALLRRRGAVVSRAELMREVWGYGEGVVSRTLDTHIFELRQLIEPIRVRRCISGRCGGSGIGSSDVDCSSARSCEVQVFHF